jgi:hypothetical protein
MAERRSSLRRRRLAFSVALVAALLGAAFLVWSISQHQDTRDDLTEAEAQLATRRADTSSESESLARAQGAVASVAAELEALDKGVIGLADLDQRDLDAVKAAFAAGRAENLADYNDAVDRRTALDAEHDAALEQLRQQANAVITALDGIQ